MSNSESYELEKVNAAPMVLPMGMEDQQPEHETISPLRRIHQMLAGRYIWAILLSVLGMSLGGVGAYMSVELTYQSRGIIRIRPSMPKILYQTEASAVMPMFDSFIMDQVELMRSQRILDMAMQSDGWKSFGHSFTDEARAEFSSHYSVKRTRQSNLVILSYNSANPREAMKAINLVIDAYMRIFGERDAQEEAQRLRVLEERRTALTAQLSSIRDRIFRIANEYGSDALQNLYLYKLTQLNQLDQAMTQTGMDLAAVGMSTEAQGKGSNKVKSPVDMTVEEIAGVDQQMSVLLNQEAAFEADLRRLQGRYGENHRYVIDQKSQLVTAQQMIEDYAAKYRERQPTLSQTVTTGTVTSTGSVLTANQLLEKMRHLQSLYEKAQAETTDLGRKMLQINSLKTDAALTEGRLATTKNRIDTLNVESSVIGGRIEVFSRATKPFRPINAGKQKQFAVLGGMVGGMGGFGIILMFGALDRRLRSSDEASASIGRFRLLGMLPDLPEDMSDPEVATIAGRCVHHIRTLLQLVSGKKNRQVFAITGTAVGSGKTSLSLALGLSFASSGSKTLLIDCDLASGGLTTRLETIISRRVGEILRRRGLVTTEQLEQALWAADTSGKLVGETLVNMGILSEADVSEALALQSEVPIGLLDAVAGEDLKSCITNAGIDRLDILPVGGAKAHDMSRISPSSLSRVIEEARGYYDVILQDTGPVPGGVETSIVTAQADGVVLVVSHGDQRSQIKSAIDFLGSIDANVEGVVFNRASTRDIVGSAMSSSLSGDAASSESRDEGEARETPTSLRSKRFGPVARAVASHSWVLEGEEKTT